MSEQNSEGGELLDVVVAEFESVKREIQARSDRQTTMLTACTTAIGLVASLYFSKTTAVNVFFIIPIVCYVFGMSWIDHDVNIRNLGRFISSCIKPKIAEILQLEVKQIPDYDREAWLNARRLGARFYLFGLPVIILFILIPSASLIIPFFLTPPDQWDGIMFSMGAFGLVLVVVLLFHFIASLVGIYRVDLK